MCLNSCSMLTNCTMTNLLHLLLACIAPLTPVFSSLATTHPFLCSVHTLFYLFSTCSQLLFSAFGSLLSRRKSCGVQLSPALLLRFLVLMHAVLIFVVFFYLITVPLYLCSVVIVFLTIHYLQPWHHSIARRLQLLFLDFCCH